MRSRGPRRLLKLKILVIHQCPYRKEDSEGLHLVIFSKGKPVGLHVVG
jgi:hypothetical protein